MSLISPVLLPACKSLLYSESPVIIEENERPIFKSTIEGKQGPIALPRLNQDSINWRLDEAVKVDFAQAKQSKRASNGRRLVLTPLKAEAKRTLLNKTVMESCGVPCVFKPLKSSQKMNKIPPLPFLDKKYESAPIKIPEFRSFDCYTTCLESQKSPEQSVPGQINFICG